MPLADPIPVRFSDVADSTLAQISARTGLSKAELVRIATDEFLERTLKSGEIVQRHVFMETHGNHSPINNNLSTSASAAPGRRPVDYKKDLAKKKKGSPKK